MVFGAGSRGRRRHRVTLCSEPLQTLPLFFLLHATGFGACVGGERVVEETGYTRTDKVASIFTGNAYEICDL